MDAIILAAGLGSRLKSMTETQPKCMTLIDGKSILERQLCFLDSLGVKKVYIVVGYKKEIIKAKFGNFFLDIEIIYCDNDDYDKTHTLYSFLIAFKYINKDFIYLEGDVVIERKAISYFKNFNESFFLVDFFNENMEGSVVELNNRYIIQSINRGYRCSGVSLDKYKTLNINFFKEDILEIINEIIQNLSEKEIREISFEGFVEVLIKSVEVSAVVVDNIKWFEIDTEDDYYFFINNIYNNIDFQNGINHD
ncbi:sugar phosphate nucleotidyltransferase [Acinetobacter pittii]|uniref:phosphocholine cytidylyltransferase family protein n=1 Tax=Acinetobacter pittii TaxID=48296 RepID=UPI00397CD9A1